MRRINYIYLAVLVMLFLMALLWVFNKGFIEVTLENAGPSARFTLYDKSGVKVSESTAATGSFKKFTTSGTYQLLVESEGKNYYQVVSIGGFFKTTEVVPSLQPERK